MNNQQKWTYYDIWYCVQAQASTHLSWAALQEWLVQLYAMAWVDFGQRMVNKVTSDG